MAVFASLIFNRNLKQFLACKDINSKQGKVLTEKIRSQATDSLEKILETIPATKKPHSDVLKKICEDEINRNSEDRFLDNLENDVTSIRTATKSVLSSSQQISPTKLFKRLHESEVSKTEIIDILEFQKEHLPPELYIKNALRMDGAYANRLIEIAQSQAHRIDMSAVDFDIDSLKNPDIKIRLIRFLAAVNKPEAAELLTRFLHDSSKIIVIEALKNLAQMTSPFDPSGIVRFLPEMRKDDRESAIKILRERMTGEHLRSLVPLLTGKQEDLRNLACEIVATNASEKGLERLLVALDAQDWWGREQAVKSLSAHGNEELYKSAALLTEHKVDFVRDAAEQLALNQTGMTSDTSGILEALMSDNWQLRESAIESAGNTKSREILDDLAKVIDKYPESSIAVLTSVRRLGFSKGLEIASRCLQMKEAAIQREALRAFASLTTQKHADRIRNGIVKMVPKLQATVRDTALEVTNNITEKFNLPKLNLDEDNLFETRLLKIEENRERRSQDPVQQPDAGILDKTEVVSFQHIEELKAGDTWMERYKVIREVGRGAMGRVMLVDDETVGERLILKFMHPELTSDGKARERFLRELKYSRKISHPHVIRIHDFLLKEGISAISMEFFESRGLDYMIKHGLLESHEQTLKILYQVSDGMFEAHQQKVIHRDLKPSNILVNDEGLAKVVDFGIASASSEAEMTLTKTGMIIGTPAYLAPERAKGLEADHRADIYALGIIAYNMLNGGLPYKGEPMSLLFQHIEGKAAPLHSLDKGVHADVSMLVEKMMAVDIEKRFQTMKEVRDTIASLI
jgi:serine/threonine-protein kinase